MHDERDYRRAEAIMAAVFSPSVPSGTGTVLPSVLGIPGWQVWLACREGVPAAATPTFDDGDGIGVYKLSTLPEHRGRGVARALMTAIVRRYPSRIISLTATAMGASLYHSLGFVSVSEALW